jgi:hypothetical protein
MAEGDKIPTPTKEADTLSESEEPVKIEYENKEDEEEAGASSSWGGWFSSQINTAKAKSNEMYQYLKQDFNEFSETVQEAGRDLKEKLKLEESAKTAAEVVGSKVNTILEQVSTIFGVAPDDDDEGITYIVGKGGPVVVSRLQAKIYTLALEERVFLEDPEDMKSYDEWTATFDLELKNDELADLLTSNPHLQLHYSQMVPEKVSHLLFWHRFYYQVHLIFKAEEEKARAAAAAKKDSSDDQPEADADSSGQDQSLIADMVNISEEDQRRLLSEYEEEMKKGESSAHHSRQSSETHMSSSSSGSFAFVTHDSLTDEVKIE